jgi:hypothetical protein
MVLGMSLQTFTIHALISLAGIISGLVDYFAMHPHEHSYLIVAVTSVCLKTSPAGETSFAENMKPGDFRRCSMQR